MEVTKESILREKLSQRITNGKAQAKPVLDLIERDGNLLKDFVVLIGSNGHSRLAWQHVNDRIEGLVWTEQGAVPLGIHDHALRQAGDKFGIPSGYLVELAKAGDWGRTLAVENLSTMTKHSPRQRVLVRSVGDEIRGLLSDKYRRLDSTAIAGQFIKSAGASGAELVNAGYDGTRMFMQALLPQMFNIETPRGSLSMAFGANFSTSDFGDGALQVSQFMMQVICLNGAVGTSMLREVHLGGTISDDPAYSQRTYRLDTSTQASKLRDLVENLLKPDMLIKRVEQLQEAASKDVDVTETLKRLRKTDLSQTEVDAVGRVLVQGREEDGVAGGGTLWKIAQAVSRVGQSANARRRQELSEVAGKLISVN